MLGDGQGRGMQRHNCWVVNGSRRTIEGQAGALVHDRKHQPKNETRTQRWRRSRASELWGKLVDRVGHPPEGSQWIHVFDRGGDHFEAVCQIVQNHCDWIIRASKMNRQVLDPSGDTAPWSEVVQQATVLGTDDLPLRSRPGQAARIAKIRVSRTTVTLPRPTHHSPYVKTCGVRQIQTRVVIAQEIDAPAGVKPICWTLLTSLPVTTFEEARQVVADYECRWLIEEYHKVLKTGCGIDRHALRTAARWEALRGLISVIGVRLLPMKTFAKEEPTTPARDRVPSTWLKVLKTMKPKLSGRELTVYEFWRELAKLGGFLGRKHDGEPGWQTLWRGYQKLPSHVQALQLMSG